MTTNFEADWGKAMQKTKQTGKIQTNPVIQKKQIDEELKYFKQELKKAIIEKNKAKAKEILKKLIKTRSRLLKISLSQRSADSEDELEKYYTECYRLTKAVDKLLK